MNNIRFKRPGKRPLWLRVMGEWGMKQDTSAVRRELAAALEQRRKRDLSKENVDWNRLQRGWCFDPKTFREELLELIGDQRGEPHSGEEVRESEEKPGG